MKLNYEFGFLAKDCPLVSRELVNPWRLAALAVGLGILIAGAHLTPSADWDYPICFIMGLWAYVFAPWTVRALVYLDWKRLPLAWLFAWAGIDGVYSHYWWLRGFDALSEFRGPNIAYSAPLYFLFGLAMNLRLVRYDAPQNIRGVLSDSVRKHWAFAGKHILQLVVSAFLALLFTILIFISTAHNRIVFSGGGITIEQKQSADNSTTERN